MTCQALLTELLCTSLLDTNHLLRVACLPRFTSLDLITRLPFKPLFCHTGTLQYAAYCARHACTRSVIKMLNRLWYLALDLDKIASTSVRRNHILDVLNKVANGGKGIRATVHPPDKEENAKHDSLKWNQSCGLTADKILEVHKELCSWLEKDDKDKFQLYTKMWSTYAAFNALQQQAKGVTAEVEQQCGILGREAMLRTLQCLDEVLPYAHVQVSTTFDIWGVYPGTLQQSFCRWRRLL